MAAAIGLFVVDVDTSADPAPFDDTVSMGLAMEDEIGLHEDVDLPRAQVFYSQYQYVVGYYGVETFVEARETAGHQQQFGYPLSVYVTDYAGADVDLDDDGYPRADGDLGWIDAEDAWFVYGSDASTPSGDTVVPFGDRADADAFVDAHGGEVIAWTDLLEQSFESDDATAVRDRVGDQHRTADEYVADREDLPERPVSAVVGEDADTIQEAIDEAPSNTTIEVPDGEYNETLEIDRPLTIRGDGDVTIRGDGNGTVITATADRTALIGLEITGSGSERQGEAPLPGDDDEDDWDQTFEVNYAGGDAGVGLHTADEVLVEDVTVHSSASGIIVRRSDAPVIRNATVYSPELATDDQAGILLFHAPGVVEESTVYDGRDAIYSHRSHGLIVRDSHFEDNRLGIHLMHTSEALLAGNDIRSQTSAGIFIMTGPERNAIVDNEIRDAAIGLIPSGDSAYVANNRLVDGGTGLQIDSTNSLVEHNVMAGNEIGANEREMLPTNRVVRNDFVGNDVHADAGSGPLRIWTHGGSGNYWQGAMSLEADGTVDRAYSPTSPVDQRLHRTDGAPTLSRAPALDAILGFQGSVPGMRTGSVTDLQPSCAPHNPELLEQTVWADDAWSCDRTTATADT
ncbi:Nitrous oxide reductase maturation protein NosD [Natrarchaeobaculum sulfurireducens]|uniref:Nitrous oxide reductase maturation protein NosD n=2 Tax=Natrarchaeobaculum sulfurireducens TaxID=2044521 RepID=A0A346PPZ2_9EURY|nr:Nitrous oxide reductase maturation protein NosD [Natrarchaeobaculum sulfurireducens]